MLDLIRRFWFWYYDVCWKHKRKKVLRMGGKIHHCELCAKETHRKQEAKKYRRLEL
jgi:hypothetical protein